MAEARELLGTARTVLGDSRADAQKARHCCPWGGLQMLVSFRQTGGFVLTLHRPTTHCAGFGCLQQARMCLISMCLCRRCHLARLFCLFNAFFVCLRVHVIHAKANQIRRSSCSSLDYFIFD